MPLALLGFIFTKSVNSVCKFSINESESKENGLSSLKEEKQCRYILQNIINKNFEKISYEKIPPREKKLISNYLYNQLCYHMEGFDRLKSFKVAKNILNDL